MTPEELNCVAVEVCSHVLSELSEIVHFIWGKEQAPSDMSMCKDRNWGSDRLLVAWLELARVWACAARCCMCKW